MSENCGFIYILTNPSFPEYVKIGYADDVKRRLKELNRSECIPFAFRIYATYEVESRLSYATYEVESRLSDKKIHSIIDRLNPNLRSIDTFEGKERKREFYAMSPEDAYSILEAIAEIDGNNDKLKKYNLTKSEEQEELIAQDVEEEHNDRLKPFNFNLVNIKPGEEIVFTNNASEFDGTIVKVVDEKQVEYKGQKWSLSSLAAKLSNSRYSVAGPRYFKYKGEWLNDIRKRVESETNK